MNAPSFATGNDGVMLPGDAAPIDIGVIAGGLYDDERRWFGISRAALGSRVAMSGRTMSQNATELVSQHSVTVSPQRWVSASAWFPTSISAIGTTQLSRRDVASVAVECQSTGDWLPLLVASFMWGQGDNGYGPARLSWILDGKDGRLAPSHEEIRHRLERAVRVLADQGAAGAYDLLNDEGRIPGLGPAFFTKFLYFAAAAVDAPLPRAVILDAVLAARMRWFWTRRSREAYGIPAARVAWLWRGPRWSTYRYQVYLAFLNRAVAQLSADGQPWTADLVEYLLFSGKPKAAMPGGFARTFRNPGRVK